MPRFTVIMPARNAGRTISAAVRSVLSAFPQDTEVVVWNDASTDNTAEMAMQAGGARVRIINSAACQGAGVARKYILASTDSEFVVNQDSDDISLPWRYKVQAPLMNNADMVFTGVVRFSKRRLHRPSLPLSHSANDVPVALLLDNPFPHPTMLAKRSELERLGGYCESRVAQDYELLLRAAAHGTRIKHTATPTLAYRISSTQISGQADYADRIINSPQVVNAYAQLLQRLMPALSLDPSGVNSVEDMSHLDLSGVETLISRMRFPLRRYYQRRFLAGHLGDLGSVILGRSQSMDK